MAEHKPTNHKEAPTAHKPAPEVSMSMAGPAPAPVAPPPIHPGAPHPTSGLAVASMVTGIVAFLFGWVIVFGFLLGATAIILGIIALKHPGPKGMSIAGIITGAVGALWSLVIGLIFFLSLLTFSAGAGTVVDQANKTLDKYNSENKALIEAKKDYTKGETAKFGQFEVKVNSVKRDYAPESSYMKADAGNEFIVVNLTVKNAGDADKYFSSYDLKIDDSGVVNTSSYLDVDPAFDSATLKAGASQTGNIVYKVKKDSTALKLQYQQYAYDLSGGGSKTLTFTLAI